MPAENALPSARKSTGRLSSNASVSPAIISGFNAFRFSGRFSVTIFKPASTWLMIFFIEPFRVCHQRRVDFAQSLRGDVADQFILRERTAANATQRGIDASATGFERRFNVASPLRR